MARISVADVDAVWAAKRDAGYKPNSIRIMRAVLRRALATACLLYTSDAADE